MNNKYLYFSLILTISIALFVQADNKEVPVPAAIKSTFQYITTAFKGIVAINSGILTMVLLHACYDAGHDLFLDIQRYRNLDEDLLVVPGLKELFMQNIKNSTTRFLVKAGIAGGLFYLTCRLGRLCLTDLGLIAKKKSAPLKKNGLS